METELMNIADQKMTKRASWGDLEYNLLQKIFDLQTRKDLFHSMASVCHWWRSVSMDMLFWKDDDELYDLSNLELFFRHEAETKTKDYPQKLLTALQIAMDGNVAEQRQRCVRSIKFPWGRLSHHKHLNFICERSPKLKKLILPGLVKTSATDIMEAMQKWEELVELFLGPIDTSNIHDFIPSIGKSCKNLSILSLSSSGSVLARYRFILSAANSLLIANNLRQLRVLNLDDALISKHGLQIILLECEVLSKLVILESHRVVDDSLGILFGLPRERLTVEVDKVVADGYTGWSIDSKEKIDIPQVVNRVWRGDNAVCMKWAIFVQCKSGYCLVNI